MDVERILKARPVRVPDYAGRHCVNRRLEWFMALAVFGEGLLVAAWPEAIQTSRFSLLLDVTRPQTFAALCLLIGGARLIALWFNGEWPMVGPMVRAVGAGVTGAFILLPLILASLEQVFFAGRPPAMATPFFIAFMISEFGSAKRAASDARRRLR